MLIIWNKWAQCAPVDRYSAVLCRIQMEKIETVEKRHGFNREKNTDTNMRRKIWTVIAMTDVISKECARQRNG